MRWLIWSGLMAVTVAVGAGTVVTERNNARTHPHGSPESSIHQVIVKLRPTAAASASDGRTEIQAARIQVAQARVGALVARTGLTLHTYRAITELMHAVEVEPAVAGETVAETLARLRADPEVEYAEADQRRYIHAVPNDPCYLAPVGNVPCPVNAPNPNYGQWYLQPPGSAGPSATDAQTAWDTTTGPGNSFVIADIDTGVVQHPDLTARLLPGYCFITDSFVANGGACPGAGAADTGDWVTSGDVSAHPNECGTGSNAAGPSASSWHGTRVAGILGAQTNNGGGVAGVTWGGMILPVRALGKCGGQDSDIINGMLWAGGIAVAGAPANPNPAKIINMSIGGTGSCPSSYIDAINQLTSKGVLVVVSAGNEEGVAVDAPANCPGVAGIAGLRQAGTKVGFSNIGPEVALSAPAGNCINTGSTDACLYTLTTTTNLGETAPGTNDYTGQYLCYSNASLQPPGMQPPAGQYAGCPINNTNQYRTWNVGTSFAAPVVSGIAALMSTVNPNLNSCQLISRLKEGAQTFPTTSPDPGIVACTVPTANKFQDECICTTQTCGAGMANAPASLTAAMRPIAAIATPSSITGGQSITLDASGSADHSSNAVSTYQWSNVAGGVMPTITNAASSKAMITVPSCGIATVSLTVTDGSGRMDSADVVITPSSATTDAPSSAGGGCSNVTHNVQVAVCPITATAQMGSAAQNFTASLAYTTNTAVTWEVNGTPGGNSTVGTITNAGVYTPPAAVPSPATVTIAAVSSVDSSVSGSAQVTITAPPKSGGGGGGSVDLLTLVALAGVLLAVTARMRPMHAVRRCGFHGEEPGTIHTWRNHCRAWASSYRKSSPP